MPNNYFQFKDFKVFQQHSAMKVTTDGCLFGAWVAGEVKGEDQFHLLDIGAGTGLLSLMIANQSNSVIDAVEIDPAAAAEARSNIDASPWTDRINLIEANILDFKEEHPYDVVVCNPPFHARDLKSENEKKNLAHHASNLDLKDIISVSTRTLREDGNIFLLLPYRRLHEAKKEFSQSDFELTSIVLVAPSALHEPIRIMIKAGRNKDADHDLTRINIRNPDNSYTQEFTSLLRPFYLHL